VFISVGAGANLNWLVKDKDIAPHIPAIGKSKREDGTFGREDFTFDKDRNVYVCPANKILTTAGKLVTTGGHFSIGQMRATVVVACSTQNAVQRRPSAKSRAVSTRKLSTLPGRRPRRRRSSNHPATGNVSKTLAAIAQNLRRIAK